MPGPGFYFQISVDTIPVSLPDPRCGFGSLAQIQDAESTQNPGIRKKIKFITEDHQKIIKRQFLFCILDQDPAIFFPGSSLGKIIDPDLVCAKRIDSDLDQYQNGSVTLIYKQTAATGLPVVE